MPHNAPGRPGSWNLEYDAQMCLDDREMKVDYENFSTEYGIPNSGKSILITQPEVNDFIRDLSKSKNQAGFLGSRLQGRNLLK